MGGTLSCRCGPDGDRGALHRRRARLRRRAGRHHSRSDAGSRRGSHGRPCARPRLADMGLRRRADRSQPKRDHPQPVHGRGAPPPVVFSFAAKSDNAPVFAAGVDVNGKATDLVYAGDRSGAFHAVDAATGQEVWSRDLGDPVTTCGGVLGVTDTAVIDRSRNALYVAGPDGRLYALDLGSGADEAGWPLQITAVRQRVRMGGDQHGRRPIARPDSERVRPARDRLRTRGPGGHRDRRTDRGVLRDGRTEHRCERRRRVGLGRSLRRRRRWGRVRRHGERLSPGSLPSTSSTRRASCG